MSGCSSWKPSGLKQACYHKVKFIGWVRIDNTKMISARLCERSDHWEASCTVFMGCSLLNHFSVTSIIVRLSAGHKQSSVSGSSLPPLVCLQLRLLHSLHLTTEEEEAPEEEAPGSHLHPPLHRPWLHHLGTLVRGVRGGGRGAQPPDGKTLVASV